MREITPCMRSSGLRIRHPLFSLTHDYQTDNDKTCVSVFRHSFDLTISAIINKWSGNSFPQDISAVTAAFTSDYMTPRVV